VPRQASRECWCRAEEIKKASPVPGRFWGPATWPRVGLCADGGPGSGITPMLSILRTGR